MSMRRPKAVVCYLCGQQYGTTSIKIHIPQCQKLFVKRENLKDKRERRALPQPPAGYMDQIQQGINPGDAKIGEFNDMAFSAYNSNLKACSNCGRTFTDSALKIHMRSCRSLNGDLRRGSNNGGKKNNGLEMSSPRRRTTPGAPKYRICYICGRKYGTTSIRIHLPQCAKLWEQRESQKPPGERRAIPQPPPGWGTSPSKMKAETLNSINQAASESHNNYGLARCPHCSRTFKEESLVIHVIATIHHKDSICELFFIMFVGGVCCASNCAWLLQLRSCRPGNTNPVRLSSSRNPRSPRRDEPAGAISSTDMTEKSYEKGGGGRHGMPRPPRLKIQPRRSPRSSPRGSSLNSAQSPRGSLRRGNQQQQQQADDDNSRYGNGANDSVNDDTKRNKSSAEDTTTTRQLRKALKERDEEIHRLRQKKNQRHSPSSLSPCTNGATKSKDYSEQQAPPLPESETEDITRAVPPGKPNAGGEEMEELNDSGHHNGIFRGGEEVGENEGVGAEVSTNTSTKAYDRHRQQQQQQQQYRPPTSSGAQKRQAFEASRERRKSDSGSRPSSGHRSRPLSGRKSSSKSSSKPSLQPTKTKKVPKWKADREAMRAAIKQNRLIQKYKREGKSLRDLPPPPKPKQEHDNREQCRFCLRRFAPARIEKHVSICSKLKHARKVLDERARARLTPKRTDKLGRRDLLAWFDVSRCTLLTPDPSTPVQGSVRFRMPLEDARRHCESSEIWGTTSRLLNEPKFESQEKSADDESDDSLFDLETMRMQDEANEEEEAMENEKKLFEESGGSNVYGILEFEGVCALLDRAKKAIGLKDKIFCDVGSGNGEAIMVAAEQYPELKGCLGIELSKFRHEKALKSIKNPEMCKKEAASKIELRCEDGLKADISSCDIVYVSNLLANEAFNKKFGEVCDRQLRPGSILFAIKEVPLSRGTKIDELTGDTDCSWGTAVVKGYKMGEFNDDDDDDDDRKETSRTMISKSKEVALGGP
eukprot:jgi/Bigna1/90719/estExt_fgenesh1_pg.C_770093